MPIPNPYTTALAEKLRAKHEAMPENGPCHERQQVEESEGNAFLFLWIVLALVAIFVLAYLAGGGQ